jgi:hypothetical protein
MAPENGRLLKRIGAPGGRTITVTTSVSRFDGRVFPGILAYHERLVNAWLKNYPANADPSVPS